MKKTLLYLLLFAYTVIVCKPVLPSLADGIAHIFWYSEHMATVHYEHGRYHVHYEYQDAAKKNYPEKDASLPKSATDGNDHFMTADTYITPSPLILLTYFHVISSCLLSRNLNSDFPPPKA
jgi:hypothetical protein